MGIKKMGLILTVLLFANCGAGTEVATVSNPNDQTQKKITTNFYTLTFNLPTDWDFIDYTVPGESTEPVFTDENPETQTIALFTKENRGTFTVFAGLLEDGQTLYDYVRTRRPEGEIGYSEDEYEGVIVAFAYFNQQEPGPNGGFVFDMYLASDKNTLWFRSELFFESDEGALLEETLNQFIEIVETAEIE